MKRTLLLLLFSYAAFGQLNLTVKERTKIYLIDFYVKNIDKQQDSLSCGIAEGEILNKKDESIGGWEVYNCWERKTNKLIKIRYNVSEEIYRTQNYYYKNDTLVYVSLTNPSKELEVNDSGEYYFINGKCYHLLSKGNYVLINRQNLQKEAQGYLNEHYKH